MEERWEISRYSPIFGTGSSLVERAANDSGRTPRLEVRIAAIGCGIEAIQGRASGSKNRGTSTNHPCAFEEAAAEIVANVVLNIEWQMTDDDEALGLRALWRF